MMTLRYALNIIVCFVVLSCHNTYADESTPSQLDTSDILTVLTSIENQCNELSGYVGILCMGAQMEIINHIWEYCKSVDCTETKRSLDDFEAYMTDKMAANLQATVADAQSEERTIEIKMDTVCSLVSAAFIAKGLLNFAPNKQLAGYEHSKEDVEASLLAIKEYDEILLGFNGCLYRKFKSDLSAVD